MKTILAYIAAGSALVSGTGMAQAQTLAGVSDQETTIPFGVDNFVRGNGDVLFVSDRADRWYRMQLNEGCLANTGTIRNIVFDNKSASNRIDRFTVVYLHDNGVPRNCRPVSIRSSKAPPQINSQSPVTLD